MAVDLRFYNQDVMKLDEINGGESRINYGTITPIKIANEGKDKARGVIIGACPLNTLDELKMYIEYLDKRVNRLYSLKRCSFFNRYMDEGIIEYEYRNFDIEEVEKDYDDATLELRKAKDTLYKYLATEEFETDCMEIVYEDSDTE